MYPTTFRLGVSYLKDGAKVLTPFGRCGKVYAYNERIALVFDGLIVAVLWLGALAAGAITAGLYLKSLDADQALALFPLTFILLDAIRVGATLWLFRRARTFPIGRRESEQARALNAAMLVGATNVLRIMIALDALMFFGAVYTIAFGLPTMAVAAIFACAVHFGVYGTQLSAFDVQSSAPDSH